ncbi:ABC transporter permease [Sphingomonas profundi]|uniref:ABC transporter permease n=1 Tax=Alterirhizorhabdus profundi TaxID=2681549 RepID=UPI0012E71DE4|nr:FtsX-like permease family protein [Sphingomonas profundi]
MATRGVALRLALRELRGGLSGLRLLALCLFLGVAAIAGVGSLSASILGALEEQGRVLLGGDLQFQVVQRFATPAERAAFDAAGRTSETVRMRAMASRLDGAESVLAELKGVDAAYPLYGKLALAPGALAARPRGTDVAIGPALAERLRVRVGDRIRIGEASLRVIGLIANEPDRLSEGFTLGPVALVDISGIAATGLVQPGSLFNARYRVQLPPARDFGPVADAVLARFPNGGWQVQNRTNGAPTTRRYVERLGQFLGLVGLTALAVAGIGVGNGVASYLDARRAGIATLKVLGASSGMIATLYLIQIGIVAIAGIVAGGALGAAVPAIVTAVAGDALPVPPRLDVYPAPLLVGAAYGVLVAALFAVAPLARARAVAAASLFRGGVEAAARPPAAVLAGMAVLLGAIVALAILTAPYPGFAAMFVGAVAALLALLAAVGRGVRRLAARMPHARRPLLRLAIANLHRPGAQTDRLVVALGLGLTLFATLAVIQTNLSGQIARTLPARAPSFFVLDIPNGEIDRFRTVVAGVSPGADVRTVPSLRGPIVSYAGRRVADLKRIPDEAWILRGDRGLTYAAALPEGSQVTAGRWWPADYAGPPLVSIDERAAEVLGLRIGDPLTVSVLGVEVTATIASFRKIDWDTMGFNFVLVYSPGVLEGAPHSYMATVAMPVARETALNRALAAAFPSVSLIRVKEVLGQVSDLLGQLGVAVRAASSVAMAAGIAVLIGAIAASRQARLRDAVLLKLLGGTRRQILWAQAIEYALLAAIVSLLALGFGAAAGWYVIVELFGLGWGPDWPTVIATLLGGAALTLAVGLLGALPALRARPARALREL